MATLTIRNVPDHVKQALRERAAANGVSMEEELRRIVADSADARRPRKSTISSEEILRRADMLDAEKPSDPRYETMTQKEISDEMWRESDGL